MGSTREASSQPDAGPVLVVDGVAKAFTGTQALAGVHLAIRRGEVHALLGENGAGKSTLIKILAGVEAPDGGSIVFAGRPVRPSNERLPLAVIHQELGLFESMSVAENIALVDGYPRRRGVIDWARVSRQARNVLDRAGGGIDPNRQVSGLSAAQRSVVAIARALAAEAEILILDEPTAALPEPDVAHLLAALRDLRARGMAMLYVTHRLDEVHRIADRITVLRDGRVVGSGRTDEIQPRELVRLVSGRDPGPSARTTIESGEAVAGLSELLVGDVGPVSLEVHAGEILGLAGLRGAGQDVVGRALAGDRLADAGRMAVGGRTYAPIDVRGAVRQGVGFVSSRRAEESLATGMSARENLYLNARLARPSRALAPIWPRDERRRASRALAVHDVRPPTTEAAIETFSGGNQQKVILARWLESTARLLVLEEPTAGVDVGAKEAIHGMLDDFVMSGRAVVLVSSDFEEVAGIAHRAYIFAHGRMTGELSRRELSVAAIIALAARVAA